MCEAGFRRPKFPFVIQNLSACKTRNSAFFKKEKKISDLESYFTVHRQA